MDQVPKKSAWRWVWRIALWVFILFVIAVGGGLAYLKTRPVPGPEVLAQAENQYRRTRTLFSDRPTTTTVARPVASSASTTSTVSAADQARCDQLMREIVTLGFDNARRTHATLMEIPPLRLAGRVEKAKSLAALYDKGVRVSPEVSAELMRNGGRNIIGWMARAIILDVKPGMTGPQLDTKMRNPNSAEGAERAGTFDRYFTALKLLRVVDYPINDYGFESLLLHQINQRPEYKLLDNVAPELMKMDLELLAPCGALDWNRSVGAGLDQLQDRAAAWQKLLNTSDAFGFFKNMNGEPEDGWIGQLKTNLVSAGGAVAGPTMWFTPRLDRELRAANQVQDYAQALAQNRLDPAKIPIDTVYTLQMQNEQIESRLRAGGIELQRGGAVPAPGQIGPDSYFFDPVMQRPYQLYVSPGETGYVYLHVRREVAPYSPRTGEKQVNEMEVTKIRLPANHPGLQGVPKL